MNFSKDMKEKIRHPEKADQDLMEKFVMCMMKKIGYMSENGEFLKESMRKGMQSRMRDPSNFDKMMVMCGKVYDTPGKTALLMLTCVRDFQDKNCGC